MEPTMDFGSLLLLGAVAQGFLLALVLSTHPKRAVSLYLLAALVLIFSMTQLHTALYWSRYLLYYPHYWAVPAGFGLLYGPLLYLYVKSIVFPQQKQSIYTLLHFVPFFAMVALKIPLYRFSAAEKIYILENYTFAGKVSVDLTSLLMSTAQTLHLLGYLFFAVLLIKKLNIQFNGRRNRQSDFHMSWLKKLILGFSAYWLCWYVYNVALYLEFPYIRMIDYLITFSGAAFIYAIGYVALRQTEPISGDSFLLPKAKYHKSALPADIARSYASKLQESMTSKSLYLDNNLTLSKLAQTLNISSHHLSQVLNEELQTSFFDYINQYRVNLAKQRITDPAHQHKTILSIALESGFNNKTSFNTAFKKHTGQTPSEFRKSLMV